MSGENYEPSPELQAEIDAALEAERRARKDPNWTPKRGIVLNAAEIAARHSPYPGPFPGYSITAARSVSSMAPGDVIAVSDPLALRMMGR